MAKIWDWVFKILAALVIPLLLWGISLEVRLAVQNSEMGRLQEDVKTALAIKEELNEHSRTLARQDEKLTAISTSLTEIKGLLRAPHP